MSGPSWYDVLGVAPDASSEEIRVAWRSGIADLDPGDRRFRSLNEAAEVLLDAQRRAGYDAELSNDGAAPAEPARSVVEPVEARRWQRRSRRDRLETTTATVAPEPTELAVGPTEDDAAPAERAAAPSRGVPVWVLAPLAVLTILMVVAAAYLFAQPSDDSIAGAANDAQAAAEREVPTILAYDYRRLDADQKATDALLTSAYRQKYDSLFAQVKANAPKLKVVITADLIASGLVRVSPDRVQVLLFVNRTTTRTDGTAVSHDQVVATMQKVGGDWLVDNLDTNQLGQ